MKKKKLLTGKKKEDNIPVRRKRTNKCFVGREREEKEVGIAIVGSTGVKIAMR